MHSDSHNAQASRWPQWLQQIRQAGPTFLLLLFAILLPFVLMAFVFQTYQVDGFSMETTLQHGDRLIVSKVQRTWSRITDTPFVPDRGEIIVFAQRGMYEPGSNKEKQLIKRVIGLPGDRVVIRDGAVTVYNNQHPDGFNPDEAGGYIDSTSYLQGDYDITVDENEVFVLGDNRSNSRDSREFGSVSVDAIVGTLVLRILPLNNTQRF